jgi:hypothetical protein
MCQRSLSGPPKGGGINRQIRREKDFDVEFVDSGPLGRRGAAAGRSRPDIAWPTAGV